MPTKRKPAEPVESSPAEPVEDSAPEISAETDADADAPTPMNRAERRAKGKVSRQGQPTSRGKVVGGHGPAHSHRNWANRRSG